MSDTFNIIKAEIGGVLGCLFVDNQWVGYLIYVYGLITITAILWVYAKHKIQTEWNK